LHQLGLLAGVLVLLLLLTLSGSLGSCNAPLLCLTLLWQQAQQTCLLVMNPCKINSQCLLSDMPT
jgi:hypothetical protein